MSSMGRARVFVAFMFKKSICGFGRQVAKHERHGISMSHMDHGQSFSTVYRRQILSPTSSDIQ